MKKYLKICKSCGIRYKDTTMSDYCPSCDESKIVRDYKHVKDNWSGPSTRLFDEGGSYTR